MKVNVFVGIITMALIVSNGKQKQQEGKPSFWKIIPNDGFFKLLYTYCEKIIPITNLVAFFLKDKPN